MDAGNRKKKKRIPRKTVSKNPLVKNSPTKNIIPHHPTSSGNPGVTNITDKIKQKYLTEK